MHHTHHSAILEPAPGKPARWYEVRARAGYAILAERIQALDEAAAVRAAMGALSQLAEGRPLRCVRAVLDE